MRALFVVAWVGLSGCSMFLGDGGTSGDGDGGPTGDSDGGQRDGDVAQQMCSGGPDVSITADCPADSDLLACYRFEDNTDDSSSNGASADMVVGVEFGEGVSGTAALFSLDDEMGVSNIDAFNVSDGVTIEAWVCPFAFASVTLSDDDPPRAGIFDRNGQYSLWIDVNGQVFCNGAGAVPPGGQLTLYQWAHVACSIDINGATKDIFVNGDLVETGTPTGLAANPPTIEGSVQIGGDAPYKMSDSHLQGAIDNLRIWKTGRTRNQLCATAGLICQ